MADAALPVLVGVIDGSVDSTTKLSWDVNKIGGAADWMNEMVSQPECHACHTVLSLVAQLYCPLEGSLYHRTVYVFTCVSRICKQNSLSFRVFRAQRLAVPSQDSGGDLTSSHPPQPLPADSAASDWLDDEGAGDWGVDADDWNDGCCHDDEGSGQDIRSQLFSHPDRTASSFQNSSLGASGTSSENQMAAASGSEDGLARGLGKLSLHASTCPPVASSSVSTATESQWSSPEHNMGGPLFAQYYINVFEEPSPLEDVALSHEWQLMKEYQQREGVCLTEWQENVADERNGRGGGSGSEGYEKSTAKHGDRTFQKFSKKIQLCPQQCIRYSYSGSPLWMTSPTQDQLDVPRCQYCGSCRQYEFQLMPALLPYLQLQGDGTFSPIEFGLVVVYTCSQSCWDSGGTDLYREEVARVQQDPDSEAVDRAQRNLPEVEPPQTG